MTFHKHMTNCYRSESITSHRGIRHFGQITKHGRNWDAEIRQSDTGVIDRCAGIWNTKKAAIEEIEFILSRPEYIQG